MHIKANRATQKNIRNHLATKVISSPLAQYGSHLLQLPSELLTHLTAYLDPVSLCALASVCRLLASHVDQDNTWRCVFLCHFLGIPPGPDANVNHPKLLLLRRSEGSWRAEFQKHWLMARRWGRTKAPTVTHRPHRAPLSTMHMLQAGTNPQGVSIQHGNCAVLSASLITGMVMRSYPFSGKVVRGHIDASNTTTTLGLGLNPGFQEASSHVSAVVFASVGGTGFVAWGLRSGSVAVTVAPRVMEVGCSARMIKCILGDSHSARVNDVCVDDGPNGSDYFGSGAADGSVKIWTLPTTQRGSVNCIWTGQYADGGYMTSNVASLSMVPCTKLALTISSGTVSAGYADGTVLVWFGVSPGSSLAGRSLEATCVRISPSSLISSAPTTLGLHVQSRNIVGVLLHRSGDDHFYRVQIDINIGIVKSTQFNGALGPLGAVVAEFPKQQRHDIGVRPTSSPFPESSTFATPDSSSIPVALHVPLPSLRQGPTPRTRRFVAAGDAHGRVCVWDWDSTGKLVSAERGTTTEKAGVDIYEVQATIYWDAGDGEGISALTWGDIVVVVGTTHGNTLVFDSLTQQLLKRIPSPSPLRQLGDESVSQIIIDGDILLVGVGEQIIAWQARKEAGPSSTGWGKATKTKKDKTGGSAAKWRQRNKLSTEISHSLHQLQNERAQSQPALRRARAQAGALTELGLDESEAIQYLMMLSRDEEDAKQASRAGSTSIEYQGEARSSSSDDGGNSPTHSNPSARLGGPSSPTGSTGSTVASTSTSPSSRRSGLNVYIPTSGRPQSGASDAGYLESHTSGSPYGPNRGEDAYRNNRAMGGGLVDEDEELRIALELSLLEQ